MGHGGPPSAFGGLRFVYAFRFTRDRSAGAKSWETIPGVRYEVLVIGGGHAGCRNTRASRRPMLRQPHGHALLDVAADQIDLAVPARVDAHDDVAMHGQGTAAGIDGGDKARIPAAWAAAHGAQQIPGCRLGGRGIQVQEWARLRMQPGVAHVVEMRRRRSKPRQECFGHHVGNEGRGPRMVDDESPASGRRRDVVTGQRACIRAWESRHLRQQSALAPVVGHALPGFGGVIGEQTGFGLRHRRTRNAAVRVDEGAVPQQVFVAGECRNAGRGVG